MIYEYMTQLLSKKFAIFLLIGFVSVVLDAGVYWFLTRQLQAYYLLARIISLILTLLWSYTANRFITFKSRVNIAKSFIKYSIINLASIVANLFLMFVAVSLFHLPDLLSLIILSGIISIFSYLSHGHWTFRDDKSV
jgi:putative flippase GtrA